MKKIKNYQLFIKMHIRINNKAKHLPIKIILISHQFTKKLHKAKQQAKIIDITIIKILIIIIQINQLY